MKEVGFIVLVAIAVMLGVIGGLGYIINGMTMPSTISKIEQLREDAAQVDPIQAEDVIGQVVHWNQIIRSQQTLNKTWWAGWATPDEWDTIELIPVPR